MADPAPGPSDGAGPGLPHHTMSLLPAGSIGSTIELAPDPNPVRAPAIVPRPSPRARTGVAVMIPAYNEAGSIAETLRSIHRQTLVPDTILVIDDCSTDATGEVARSLGATVVRTPRNRGCKAHALNHGLGFVDSRFIVAIDADTALDRHGLERLMGAFLDPTVAGSCGFAVPRRVSTLWERGRYIEYLFGFGFFKAIQDFYERPLLASGCFSAFRTDALEAAGGWPSRTVAEDTDLTWMLYVAGKGVRFVPDAVCYPIEPRDLRFLCRQLRRWNCGFIQTVKVHWRDVVGIPVLGTIVAVAILDATLVSLALLFVLPLLVLFVSPIFLLGYLIDIPTVLVPVLVQARRRGETLQALASLPGYFVLRFVNAWFMLVALWRELVTRDRLSGFDKGH